MGMGTGKTLVAESMAFNLPIDSYPTVLIAAPLRGGAGLAGADRAARGAAGYSGVRPTRSSRQRRQTRRPWRSTSFRPRRSTASGW